MSTAAKTSEPVWRWQTKLRSARSLDDDLGSSGVYVGPRKGPDARSHGEKEDYVLRRLLVAWVRAERMGFPAEIFAEAERKGEPDFLLVGPAGETLGIEITEAGEEDYQKWLTATEDHDDPSQAAAVPLAASTDRTAEAIREAVAKKVDAYDKGKYRGPTACDLVVYDNTAWGGLLDKRDVLNALGRPKDLLGRFREIHLVTEGVVVLDVLGPNRQVVDVRRSYETDFAGWLFDQAERLRSRDTEQIDFDHLAEEVESLARSDKRALGSHLLNLMMHLLKWEHQPAERSESWRLSIELARREIYDLLTESPSLRGELAKSVSQNYRRARSAAARETDLPEATFPQQSPYEIEQLLDPEFLPGEGRRRKS